MDGCSGRQLTPKASQAGQTGVQAVALHTNHIKHQVSKRVIQALAKVIALMCMHNIIATSIISP
jgi:hypothetical protein